MSGVYIHCWAIQDTEGRYLVRMVEEDFGWSFLEEEAKKYFYLESAAEDVWFLLQHNHQVVLKPVVKPANYGYEAKRSSFRGPKPKGEA